MKQNFGKFLNPRNYLRKMGKNLLMDRLVKPVPFSELKSLQGVEVGYFDFTRIEYEQWIKDNFQNLSDDLGHSHHKKILEFFTSAKLLDPTFNNTFLDAAGGQRTYLHQLSCREKILQDITIPSTLVAQLGDKIKYIECDVEVIPLKNETIDKISCHHSFEHFQSRSDILFIHKIQQLLRVNGKSCIIPIFISHLYTEITDAILFNKKFDPQSRRIIDITASLPGGVSCGNFARVYNIRAFQDRVINNINSENFKTSILEIRMDGKIVPDLTLKCNRHAAIINCPYRVLLIERLR